MNSAPPAQARPTDARRYDASLPIGVLRMSPLRRTVIRVLRDCDLATLAREVAFWYEQAPAVSRAKVLSRLLRPVGPLASLALAGGAFARFALRDQPDNGVDVMVDEELPAIEPDHVRHLVEYVGQADPHLVEIVAGLLTQDLPTVSYLSETLIGKINAQLRDLDA